MKMSDVETFYYALAEHFGNTTKWQHLHPAQQLQFVQAINSILKVMQQPQGFNGFQQ